MNPLLRSTLPAILAAAALTGCMASGVQLTLERATFDLNCPQDKIAVTQLSGISERGSGSVFGAVGCGKRATYLRTARSGIMLNSPIQDDK